MTDYSKRQLFRSPERERTPAGNTHERTCFDWFCISEAVEKKEVLNDTSSPTTSSESSGESRRRKRLKGRKLKICIVESVYANLMIATRVLHTFDFLDDDLQGGFKKHEIVQVTSGLEALELMRRMSFDIVFMDISIPDIGGFEATKTHREYERSVTAVVPQIIVGMIDADDGANRGAQALDAGMDLCLRKPFTVDKYNQVLDVLEGKEHF